MLVGIGFASPVQLQLTNLCKLSAELDCMVPIAGWSTPMKTEIVVLPHQIPRLWKGTNSERMGNCWQHELTHPSVLISVAVFMLLHAPGRALFISLQALALLLCAHRFFAS